MDEIELALGLAFGLGVACGYAIRSAISALRRWKAYRLQRARTQAEIDAAVSIEDVSRPNARSPRIR
jgi:hypothetical protein